MAWATGATVLLATTASIACTGKLKLQKIAWDQLVCISFFCVNQLISGKFCSLPVIACISSSILYPSHFPSDLTQIQNACRETNKHACCTSPNVPGISCRVGHMHGHWEHNHKYFVSFFGGFGGIIREGGILPSLASCIQGFVYIQDACMSWCGMQSSQSQTIRSNTSYALLTTNC